VASRAAPKTAAAANWQPVPSNMLANNDITADLPGVGESGNKISLACEKRAAWYQQREKKNISL